MKNIMLLVFCLAAAVALVAAANYPPVLVGGGGTPPNSVQFPENSTRAYIQAVGGALNVASGGTNQNITLTPSGTGAINTPASIFVSGQVNPSPNIAAMRMSYTSVGGDIASFDWTTSTWKVTAIRGNPVVLNNNSSTGPVCVWQASCTYSLDSASDINTATNYRVGGTLVPTTPGTGLAASGATLNSNAVYQVSYQPGLITAVAGGKAAFSKVGKAGVVDNIVGSALLFTCTGNPTVTMYECGTSATCASPTSIGSVTVTGASTAVTGTVTNPSIIAGDYVAWAISAGTCTSLDIAAVAQVHSN